MSAYIVGNDHIHAMISAGLHLPGHGSKLRWFPRALAVDPNAWQDARELTYETADAVGEMLIRQNVRSVRYRYPGDTADDLPGPVNTEWAQTYTFDLRARFWDLSPLVVMKTVDCYAYQSCEDDGWHRSEAYQFCDALTHAAIHALPGYDNANGWDFRRPADSGAILITDLMRKPRK